MNAPKVSIIIPVYNAETFIADCINSVLAQTEQDWELILVDDCSKDNTLEIIQSIINGDVNGNGNFFLLRQERNQGPSAARNRGIREAKGEYVFFLDADDTITPDCIELLYELAKQHDVDYVQGKYQSSCLHEGWEVQKVQEVQDASLVQKRELPSALSDRREIKRLLLNHNKIQFTPHNRLVRRQMIIDNNLFFNEEIKVREDFLWMTFVAKYVKRFASCDKPTYIRGYNEDSLTNNINKEREIAGYRFLIETMVANYDRFQLGYQKELALEALMMALKAGYYHNEAERQHLIEEVMSKNNCIENILLKLYLRTYNPKVLHLLVRIYKR
jgi:glycosyltransferase involved in cell wall biosynthesis